MPIIDREGKTIGIVTLDDLLALLGDEMSDMAKAVSETFFRRPPETEPEDYHWWATYG
jgi:CBS domain containing-hemolysin-like protein